jgi:hypothetical protein
MLSKWLVGKVGAPQYLFPSSAATWVETTPTRTLSKWLQGDEGAPTYCSHNDMATWVATTTAGSTLSKWLSGSADKETYNKRLWSGGATYIHERALGKKTERWLEAITTGMFNRAPDAYQNRNPNYVRTDVTNKTVLKKRLSGTPAKSAYYTPDLYDISNEPNYVETNDAKRTVVTLRLEGDSKNPAYNGSGDWKKCARVVVHAREDDVTVTASFLLSGPTENAQYAQSLELGNKRIEKNVGKENVRLEHFYMTGTFQDAIFYRKQEVSLRSGRVITRPTMWVWKKDNAAINYFIGGTSKAPINIEVENNAMWALGARIAAKRAAYSGVLFAKETELGASIADIEKMEGKEEKQKKVSSLVRDMRLVALQHASCAALWSTTKQKRPEFNLFTPLESFVDEACRLEASQVILEKLLKSAATTGSTATSTAVAPSRVNLEALVADITNRLERLRGVVLPGLAKSPAETVPMEVFKTQSQETYTRMSRKSSNNDSFVDAVLLTKVEEAAKKHRVAFKKHVSSAQSVFATAYRNENFRGETRDHGGAPPMQPVTAVDNSATEEWRNAVTGDNKDTMFEVFTKLAGTGPSRGKAMAYLLVSIPNILNHEGVKQKMFLFSRKYHPDKQKEMTDAEKEFANQAFQLQSSILNEYSNAQTGNAFKSALPGFDDHSVAETRGRSAPDSYSAVKAGIAAKPESYFGGRGQAVVHKEHRRGFKI